MVLKTTPASQKFEAARLEMVRVFQRYGDELTPTEQLAIASYFVGQLMAVQDPLKFTSETLFELVLSNIELGNVQAVESILAERAKANG